MKSKVTNMFTLINILNIMMIGLMLSLDSRPVLAQTLATCITNELIKTPSCGNPYLGAYSSEYPVPPAPNSDWLAQLGYFEQRTNPSGSLQLYPAFAHVYNSPDTGSNPPNHLTSEEIAAANGLNGTGKYGNTLYNIPIYNYYLLMDWHPVSTTGATQQYSWADAGGCSSDACQAVNLIIEQMADSINNKINDPNHPLFIALGDEPQSDVSSEDPNGHCSVGGNGTEGTPQQYIAMWQNVRTIFKNKGVNNVIWVLIYQSDQSPWSTCLVSELYPGPASVDWIAADIYDEKLPGGTTARGWHEHNTSVNEGNGIADLVYTEFSADGFGNKPWMVTEFGSGADLLDSSGNGSDATRFYQQLSDGVTKGYFPNFQAYIEWDAMGDKCNQIEYSDPSGTQCAVAVKDNFNANDLTLDTAKQNSYITSILDNGYFTTYQTLTQPK